ncbi:tetratricopeptide repeat protein, putative [Entamoeba invadens IP1]|uniref:tetratricopeptide repeat protein, putative n=1 Tax=Entamoeba invadens IP1 TaxID=370355 RepID=UPI0002C3FA32|nr:tetratricopeptide repeat protein, putative [Entamoeba invadens IP1]ELP85009.1 tetratricopeptide repeat protein, putative [Entamoeba invadens IP1]|eukprot:XP_004184355.1 tetratricopeptide repeat protein, putative [Entamoeba invadens IP1]
MQSRADKQKISRILDHVDINQLKVLIDEAGVVVLQIKNYGTLNIGNDFEDTLSESSSYSSSESATSSSCTSSSECSSDEEEKEEKRVGSTNKEPKETQKETPKETSLPKTETVENNTKRPSPKEFESDEDIEKIRQKDLEEAKQAMIEERKRKAVQDELNKKKAEMHTKANLKVEDVDDEDEYVPVGKLKTKEDEEKAAEYVARSKKIQNRTNDVVIDKELAMGYLYVNNNKLTEAVEYFTTFLSKYPNVVGGLLGRGSAYAMLARFQEAIVDFTQAIKIDPTCGDSYKRRGQTLAATGNLERALHDFNKAIELCKETDADCYSQRGSLFQQYKNYELAKDDFKKSLKLNASDASAWNHLGLNNNALGLIDEAADAYVRALQINDKYVECYVNLAQLQKDAGQFQKSKDIFMKLFRMCPTHSYAHYVCGVLYQQNGMHTAAVNEFKAALDNRTDPQYGLEKDKEKLLECWRYSGVTKTACGFYRSAVTDYNTALGMESADVSWYMKEVSLYSHHLLDKPLKEWDLESFLPSFKEGFCKKLIPAALIQYVEQNPFDSKILDVDEKSVPNQKLIESVLEPAMSIGNYIKYDSQGFVGNKRQFMMAGLAAIEMGQYIRDKLPEWVFGGLTVEQAQRYLDKIKWRDLLNIPVKWRQLSEPNDQVYWIDLLTNEQFEEGFGSHTAMFIGQTRVVRYYCQFERAFKMVKQLLPGQISMKDDMAEKVRNAKDMKEILDLLKSDFQVTTPCKSANFDDPNHPGQKVRYDGTYLIVERKEPGYEFAIKTPCTLKRWKLYDKELEACWRQIVLLALTRKGKDYEIEPLMKAVTTFLFYWYNFMPLSRGTAVTGFVFLLGMFASFGLKLNKHIPKGLQTDWEAILCEDPEKFNEIMFQWMDEEFVKFDIDSIPEIPKAIPTLRSALECLNYCNNVKY